MVTNWLIAIFVVNREINMQQTTHPPTELVWGASAIARIIGRTDRQTFHLLQSGELPAKKVGDRWVADRDELIRFFKQTGEAA